MDEHIVVLVTAKDQEEAQRIADQLVRKKLAACANIVDNVHSVFWWDGKKDTAQESLLVIKTRRDLFNDLQAEVKDAHSYDVPEIIALPIVAGNQDYLNWINDSTNR